MIFICLVQDLDIQCEITYWSWIRIYIFKESMGRFLFGFRSDKLTTDAIFLTRQIIQKPREHQIPLHFNIIYFSPPLILYGGKCFGKCFTKFEFSQNLSKSFSSFSLSYQLALILLTKFYIAVRVLNLQVGYMCKWRVRYFSFLVPKLKIILLCWFNLFLISFNKNLLFFSKLNYLMN